ncbi:MAG: hypothetical protein AAFZ07_13570 [Actinomycetota bacterium]
MDDAGLPIVGVRLAEGRSGSTLLMGLLATSERIVFDDRYPAEYRFVSYFARVAEAMTEPFDERRHPGVTPFFFGPEPLWGPIPFETEVVELTALRRSLLRQMWVAWSGQARAARPAAELYAEKLAVDVRELVDAGLPVRAIDLVRDPRDVLASIRSFTDRGVDGFGREGVVDEQEYLHRFLATFERGLTAMLDPEPASTGSSCATRTWSPTCRRPQHAWVAGSASSSTPSAPRRVGPTIGTTRRRGRPRRRSAAGDGTSPTRRPG